MALVKIEHSSNDAVNEVLDLAADLALVHLENMNIVLTVKAGKGTRLAGAAKYRRATDEYEIVISRYFIEECGHDFILDTILHEIAHIIAGIGTGHSALWKTVARSLGAKPNAHHSVSLERSKKWRVYCPDCGNEGFFARKPKLRRSCPCHGNQFDPNNVMVLEQLY